MINLLVVLFGVIAGSTAMQNAVDTDVQVELENTPLYKGTASWYDYTLNINGEIKDWSKTHDTCALRIYERYKKYKVCTEEKCIVCKHNDFGPAREDRVIDLSSHAFKQLAPLSRGLVHVKVYLLEE